MKPLFIFVGVAGLLATCPIVTGLHGPINLVMGALGGSWFACCYAYAISRN